MHKFNQKIKVFMLSIIFSSSMYAAILDTTFNTTGYKTFTDLTDNDSTINIRGVKTQNIQLFTNIIKKNIFLIKI